MYMCVCIYIYIYIYIFICVSNPRFNFSNKLLIIFSFSTSSFFTDVLNMWGDLLLRPTKSRSRMLFKKNCQLESEKLKFLYPSTGEPAAGSENGTFDLRLPGGSHV